MSPQEHWTAAELQAFYRTGREPAKTPLTLDRTFSDDSLERQVRAGIPAARMTILPPVLDERMNSTEGAYALRLEAQRQAGDISWWRFEPFALRLGKDWKTTYRPDFLVMLASGALEVHEVKGFWRDDARVKIKVAAAMFPCYAFVAVTRKRGEWREERF